MHLPEETIITVLCMIYRDDSILLQDRHKDSWEGFTFPGGHVKKKESFVQAVIREIKEETGLDIYAPKFCGVEQFWTKSGIRYIVLLFKTNQFTGQLVSSIEGKMQWMKKNELNKAKLVSNFFDILKIFQQDDINELVYDSLCFDEAIYY